MALIQTIQTRRRVSGSGQPDTLAPGELAYNVAGRELYAGDGAWSVQMVVSASRQVELAGIQTITGAKTIAVDKLKVPGGAAGQMLQTDGAGNLSFVPTANVSATPPEVDAGTRDDVYISPLDLRSVVGASTATLATTAKTLVPAINELQAAVAGLAKQSEYVGSFNGSTGFIDWTTISGITDGVSTLPAPATANIGWQLICSVEGTNPSGLPAGVYHVGDWLLSDGTAWNHLAFGGITAATASQVGVSPSVAGGSNVQAALTGLDNAKIAKAGDSMSGFLTLSGNPTAVLHAAPKQYVDTAVAGATVKTASPELSGNGLLATPITFNGISHEPTTFGGNGLTATPLTLLVVDGGTWT
jgi:hypothetical protein